MPTSCNGAATPRATNSPAAGQPSGVSVTLGSRRPAQPPRIGPGVIRARCHATGQDLGEHERGGGLEFGAEQLGGAGRLESQGPPVLATRTYRGEFHLAPRLPAQPSGPRHDPPAGPRELADPPPLADRPPAGRGHGPAPRGFPGSRGTPSPPVPRPRGPSPTARATADPGDNNPRVTPLVPGTARTIRPPRLPAGQERSSAPQGCGLLR